MPGAVVGACPSIRGWCCGPTLGHRPFEVVHKLGEDAGGLDVAGAGVGHVAVLGVGVEEDDRVGVGPVVVDGTGERPPPVVLGVGRRCGVWGVAYRDVVREVLVMNRGVELVGVGGV